MKWRISFGVPEVVTISLAIALVALLRGLDAVDIVWVIVVAGFLRLLVKVAVEDMMNGSSMTSVGFCFVVFFVKNKKDCFG